MRSRHKRHKSNSENIVRKSSGLHFFSETSGSFPDEWAHMTPEQRAFMEQVKANLQQYPVAYLESPSPNAYLANRVLSLKQKRALSAQYSRPTVIRGPTIDRGVQPEPAQFIVDQMCAQTISTYPAKHPKDLRDGDPVCDRYGYLSFGNRSFGVIADGCNWGERPRVAAEKARDTIIEYFINNTSKIHSIADMQWHLLYGFSEAHRAICEIPPKEVGNTTLIAGGTLELESEASSEFVFVCASVGDCKAFLLEHDVLKIHDITLTNTGIESCSNDCGGRLGLSSDGPDLRNLRTFCASCKEGDMIILLSDGVHDNFHPEMLGITPRDLQLDFDDWKAARTILSVEEVSSVHRLKLLSRLILDCEQTPEKILAGLMNYVQSTTECGRLWMEENPGKRVPPDYSKYPGKMDHSTCLIFRIGRGGRVGRMGRSSSMLSKVPPVFRTELCVPISVTFTRNAEFLSIHCKTIARGKFDCFIAATQCTIQVAPEKQFHLGSDQELILDELSKPVTRILKYPNNITVDTQSKRVQVDRKHAIVSIRLKIVSLL